MPLAYIIAEVQAAAHKALPDMTEDRAVRIMATAQMLNISRNTAIGVAGAIIAAIAWDDEEEARRAPPILAGPLVATTENDPLFVAANVLETTTINPSEGNADAPTEQTERRSVDLPIGELGIEGDRRVAASGTEGREA